MKIDIVQKQAARTYKKTMTISMSGEGSFVIRAEEKAAFVANEPNAEKFLRLYIGPDEFIKRRDRYCLWHRDVPPSDLRTMPSVMQRVAGVREYRLASRKEQTRKRAATPTRFAEDRQPDSDYILIPRTSSERRAYLPIVLYAQRRRADGGV